MASAPYTHPFVGLSIFIFNIVKLDTTVNRIDYVDDPIILIIQLFAHILPTFLQSYFEFKRLTRRLDSLTEQNLWFLET